MKVKILVFPCGSEIGLEIYKSLQYSTHVQLIGGSSVSDHGRFTYEQYIGGIPNVESTHFLEYLNDVIIKEKIDFVYPAHDSVVLFLSKYEQDLKCRVIGSPVETTEICRSKLKTYYFFQDYLTVPTLYEKTNDVHMYPVFLKPDVGQGSKGTYKVDGIQELNFYTQQFSELLILEYLPGKEYTVDCFTDKDGVLRFMGPRERARTSNGISVNTKPVLLSEEFEKFARVINEKLKFRGAWFFQVKRNYQEQLCLLEIAPRIAGSMAMHRCLGINFALLSIFDACDLPISIQHNSDEIEMDRALTNKYKININFEHVYVDLDDCLIINDKLNIELLGFLFQCINQDKRINLISRHKKPISETLTKFRIATIFDNIYHLDLHTAKSSLIKETNAIFIDDSFAERREVFKTIGIPVYSPDAVESLLT